ncbi:MAG: serine hydrolase [Chitinophagaceae bacterium]|nr:serine hydrolase [Chitinophagaceae bacterium]
MDIQASIQALVDKWFGPLVYTTGTTPSSSKAPGGICGVYYGDQNYYFPYGSIDESGTPPDENTIFGVGSVTKTFTTSILGQHPILFSGSYNDNWKVANNLPAGYALQGTEEDVTFAQLATFTAGIPTVPPEGQQTDQQQFINFINSINPPSLPANNVYSDSSIGFLGQVLMHLDGYTVFDGIHANEWAGKRLFAALSMANTGFPAKEDASHPLSMAFKFLDEKNAYGKIDYSPWTPWGTAGRMFSTCSDMLNFVQANCGVTEINGHGVPQGITAGMLHAQTDWVPKGPNTSPVDQGFAWILINAGTTDEFCGKAGGVPGVSSFVTACRSMKLGVVFLTNMMGLKPEGAAIGLTKELQSLTKSTA